MEKWYEVFDNEQVQLLTRKQAATLMAVGIALVSITVTLLLIWNEGILSGAETIGSVALIWSVVLRWGIRRFHTLKSIFWCVKLSQSHLVGYDYARKKTSLDWHDIRRVDLTAEGLLIMGTDNQPFEVLHLFPDFAALSHRVCEYAELYEIPIFVDGRPWESLDVFEIYPSLVANRPPDTSGTPSGPAPL